MDKNLHESEKRERRGGVRNEECEAKEESVRRARWKALRGAEL